MGTSWDVVNGIAFLLFLGWRIGAINIDNWNFEATSIFNSNTYAPEEIVIDGYEYRVVGGDKKNAGSERETSQHPVKIDRN